MIVLSPSPRGDPTVSCCVINNSHLCVCVKETHGPEEKERKRVKSHFTPPQKIETTKRSLKGQSSFSSTSFFFYLNFLHPPV